MATAKTVEPYFEDSLERASYLAAHGIKPTGGKWMDKEGIMIFRFTYKPTAALGKLLMSYKSSVENAALSAFLGLYRLRGQYIKQSRSFQPVEPEAADLSRFLINFSPAYGKQFD